MKVTKRICSLLLTLALAAIGLPVYAENSPEEISEITAEAPSQKYIDNVRILSALGIYSFGDRAHNDTVTRGEFAYMVAELLGANVTNTTQDCNCFSDVDAQSPYHGAIHSVSVMGLMNGMGDSTFRPDAEITYIQALKVLVAALGYKPLADAKGGYFAGYLESANNIGLSSSASNGYDAAITFEVAVELIKKTAETEVFDIVSISNKSTVYKAVDGKTLLNVYHNIFTGKGTMTDNGITALDGSSSIGKDGVRIGENTFSKAYEGAKKYLGYNLEYYFRDENGFYTLLYAKANGTRNNIVSVNARDLLTEDSSFSKKCLVVDDNGKKQEYDIYRYANFIYNGAYDATFTSDSLKISQGEITLIDSDSNREYETVIVEEYEDIVVQSISTDTKRILAKLSANKEYSSIDYSGYRHVVFENSDGQQIDPATIKADNVISTFLSKDKSKARFVMSPNTDEITVDIISSEDGTKIYEAEKSYAFSVSYEKASSAGNLSYPKPVLGQRYRIYLNYEGYVVAMSEIGDVTQYAYFMGIGRGDGLDSSSIYVRLFLDSNDCVVAKTAKKVTVNKIEKQEPSKLFDAETKLVDLSGDAKPQLVKVALNAKGELTEIETAQNDVPYLTKGYSEATSAPTIYSFDLDRFTLNYQDMQNTNAYGPTSGAMNVKIIQGGFAVDNDTKFFIINNTSDTFETTDEDEIEVINYETFQKVYGKAHMKLYDADETWICGAALLSSPTSLNARFFTVAESPRYVLRDDMTIMQVSGYFKNNYWNFYEAKENVFSDAVKAAGYNDGSVKPGDVFQITFDTDTISIAAARLAYSPLRNDKGSYYTPLWTAYVNGSNDEFWMLGTLMSYNNGAFGIYSEKKLGQALDNYWMKPLAEDSSYTFSPVFLPNYLNTVPTILQFDCLTQKLTRVTINDIPVAATVNATGDGFDITDRNTMVFVNRARAIVSDVLIVTNLDAVN